VTGLLRRSDVRLLTVTGTGGTGKTRLALAATEELVLELRDGAYFVDLAPLTEAHLVATRVADALGVTESGSRPLVDTLKRVLRGRTLLLVLDNFEHVLEAAPLVGELLAASPGLTALVTSRAPLRVSGEYEYSLAPLGIPSSAEAASSEALALNDAAALFTARAVAVRPEFTITATNAAAIAGICSELDGLPLALELAAARMKLLSPEALLERLHSRRDTLGSGARDLPARQQTLRNTINWSYGLLGSDEQELFARFAVFAGGFTVEAAEAVCRAGLDPIGSLVDQSLVRRLADDDEPRFAMLETVREYALERLVSSGEAEAVRRRHAEYFLTLAERLESTIRERSTLAAIQREHDNLRAALAFFKESSALESELRLCGAVGRFWCVRGYLSEGRAHIEHALEQDEGNLPDRRATALDGASRLAWVQGDYGACIRFIEESLVLYQELGDDAGMIRALIGLGLAVQARGELGKAKAHHGESLALARKLGRRREEGFALGNLGDVAIMEGDYERARILYSESLALCREVDDAESTAIALMCLGIVALRHDDNPGEAAPLFGESLGLFLELGFKERMGTCLAGLAAVSARRDGERAGRLLGAAHALLQDVGARAEIPWERPLLAETGETIRARLGDDAFTAAFELGRSSPQEMVQDALSSVSSPTAAG